MVWLELKHMVDVLGIAEQVLVGIFCMEVMEVTLGTAAEPREGSWQDDVLLSLVFNGIYLFCNTLRRLLPMAMSYAGGNWLYRQGRSAKAFAL